MEQNEAVLLPTQLRLAVSTTILAASNSDDALAWRCVEQILAIPEDSRLKNELLIDSVASVNLILLESLLVHIKRRLQALSTSERKELAAELFAKLEGVDATKRLVAVDWWQVNVGLLDDANPAPMA